MTFVYIVTAITAFLGTLIAIDDLSNSKAISAKDQSQEEG